jgi:predicted CoA-binding protein
MDAEKILKDCKVIAVVGASPNPDRASYRVFNYLCDQGFEAIPVNPTVNEVCGKTCYSSLSNIPVKVDVVDIFRRAEDCPAIVDEAIKIGAKAIWMQEGIVNGEAEAKARIAGMMVVMDHCIMKEHRRLKS